MSIILEQVGNNVYIYADEPLSFVLYEYFSNELQQRSVHSEKVIATHYNMGTEVHTAVIEVFNANIESVLTSVVDRFEASTRKVDNMYFIELKS